MKNTESTGKFPAESQNIFFRVIPKSMFGTNITPL